MSISPSVMAAWSGDLTVLVKFTWEMMWMTYVEKPAGTLICAPTSISLPTTLGMLLSTAAWTRMSAQCADRDDLNEIPFMSLATTYPQWATMLFPAL